MFVCNVVVDVVLSVVDDCVVVSCVALGVFGACVGVCVCVELDVADISVLGVGDEVVGFAIAENAVDGD